MALTMRSVWLTTMLATAAFAQQPVLEISGANFRPVPLAVAMPVTQDANAQALSAEFDSALLFDLTACGLFQVLDRKSYLSPPTEGVAATNINFTNWLNIGAEALVKTQLSGDGETLRGDVRLFTVASGREDLKVSESVGAKDARRLAHKLANAVYRAFTKEVGPFETKIAFARRVPGGKDVFLADWDGKNAQAMASGGINVLPAVMPDRTGVAFTSYRQRKPELFVAHASQGADLLVSAGRMVSGVAYSPGGRQIAYSVSDGEFAEIWVANADGSSPRKLTDTKYFLNSSPAWSPDGQRIAFVSNRAGGPQLYVMSAQGGEARRLTFQGKYNTTPSWSPRGDVIAFTARDERNSFDIFTVNVQSGKITRLTQGVGNNEEPSYSPTGRLILFTSTRNGGAKQLFIMTADGQNQTALTNDKNDYATPDWGQ